MKLFCVAEITCESNGNIFSFFSQPKGWPKNCALGPVFQGPSMGTYMQNIAWPLVASGKLIPNPQSCLQWPDLHVEDETI